MSEESQFKLIDTAYRRGRRNRRDGVPLHLNPYPAPRSGEGVATKTFSKHASWVRGWLVARLAPVFTTRRPREN